MQTIDYNAPIFEKMIKSKFLYVDKTQYLWKLITQKETTGFYFLSRPRRFGKSLTVSTLKTIFQGKRELFKGLVIYDKYDWTQTYPVLHLDLSGFKPSNDDYLRDSLRLVLERQRDNHTANIEISIKSPKESFVNLISAVASSSTSGKVVILIDEYDAPILDTIDKPYVGEILDTLQGFYSAIKTCSELLRFVFITGVSKFSHVSIFSGLNNLEDISMDPEYATMLGYTQKELEENFADYIDKACAYKGMGRTQLLTKIAEWYGGYRFCEDTESVYNPMSIACFFSDEEYEFNNYWYSTATPSFLVKYAKTKNFDLAQNLHKPLKASKLAPAGIGDIGVPAIMFQTGYLTIKDSYIKDGVTYYNLDFPNYEVKQSFDDYLVNKFIH